ncbi:MAG: 30S ribosomal protein S21 [Acidobacteriota bacterium]
MLSFCYPDKEVEGSLLEHPPEGMEIMPDNVEVRVKDDLEKALRKFRRKYEAAGILRDIKQHMAFEKPSERRRREQRQSIRRLRKQLARQEEE